MTSRRDGNSLPATATRDAILAGAATVFREVGFQTATVDDIRRRADVSKATFYFYFASKDEVFITVADAINASMHERIASLRFRPDQGTFERIVTANWIYIRTMLSHRRIFGDYLALSLINPRFRIAYSANTRVFQARLERHITRLVDAKVLSVENVRLMAISLIGMLQMLLFRYFNESDIVGTGEIDLITLLRAASQAWYRALYGHEAPGDFDFEAFVMQLADDPITPWLIENGNGMSEWRNDNGFGG